MIPILTALTEDQSIFLLANSYTRDELQLLRKKHSFYCPSCQAQVVLKIGQIKTPHFSHISHSECEGFSEPESLLHLQGKRSLLQFFHDRDIPVELEKYIPFIRQRADLLINQQTVVEFQCSPISVAQLTKRTESYKSLGLSAIWIKGTKGFPEEGIQVLRLNAYEQAMLRKQSTHYYYLLLFVPDKNRFFYYSNLIYISGNRWIGKGRYLSAERQSFPFAIPRRLSRLEFQQAELLFSHLRRQFVRSQFYVKNRFQSIFWLSCYELQFAAGKLPEHIGLPFWQAQCIAQPAVLWQLQALAAQRKGVKMSALAASGKLPVRNSVDSSEVVKLLEDFLDLYQWLEEKRRSQAEVSDRLYDIYCQNL